MDASKYMNIPDAAAFLGIQQGTLHSQVSKGYIAHEVFFGKKCILISDLEEYKNRAQPDGQPKRGRPRKLEAV